MRMRGAFSQIVVDVIEEFPVFVAGNLRMDKVFAF
jgi:hypothetical protein